MSGMIEEALPLAGRFLEFVNRSPTAFHAVSETKQRLLSRGYTQLLERDHWKVKPSGRYFFTRNASSIVAFSIGGRLNLGGGCGGCGNSSSSGMGGFKIVGAHTDSPDLRLKPISAQSSQGYLQVGVQTYGGGLWSTWFDRDLTVAGRVIVNESLLLSSSAEQPSTATTSTAADSSSSSGTATAPKKKNEESQHFAHRIVHIPRPILRIPMLAVHLNRDSASKFEFNTETHLLPVIATTASQTLGQPATATATATAEKKDEPQNEKASVKRHHSVLIDLLSKELKTKPEAICDFDLSVVDTQPACIAGANNEFIFSPRLDNLLSCFCALEALLNSEESLENDTDVRMIALFDNEEVGSGSAQGAGSVLLHDTISRLSKLLFEAGSPADAYDTTLSRSFIVSADMAHAVHPNYPEKHQDKHRPEMHKGLVIKSNANLRYATNAQTGLVIRELARRCNVPIQDFVVRNDFGCGSTIGPILSANCGIRTVDVGIPQLSMHSIREMCATTDLLHTVRLMQGFFEQFREVDSSMSIDC